LATLPAGVADADTGFGPIYAYNGSNRCLDVRKQDNYYAANARVQIWDCTGALEQQWASHFFGVTPPAGEFGTRETLYQIINERSGMCMEVRTGDLTAGRQVDQVPCGTGSIDDIANQLWDAGQIASFSNGTGRFSLSPWSAMRSHAAYCLDIRGGSGDNSSLLQQFQCTYHWNQLFSGSIAAAAA
jgi:hypothetical protein